MSAASSIIISLTALLTCACANGRFAALDHEIVVDRIFVDGRLDPGLQEGSLRASPISDEEACEAASKDELQKQRAAITEVFDVDLEMSAFESERRLFYSHIIDAIAAHPGLRVATLTARGEQAYWAPKWRSTKPAPWKIRFDLRHRFHGHWFNYFIGFPGMIPLTPTWRGYSYACDLHAMTEIGRQDRGLLNVRAINLRAEFREKNAPRSIAFHYWPTNGAMGTQFVLGIFMSLTLIGYEPQDSSPVFQKACGARLGWHMAQRLYEELLRAQARSQALSESELIALRREHALPFEAD